MKKRLFSVLTALALCLTLLPMAALADEGENKLDFSSATSDFTGTGYQWSNESKTLTLDGLDMTVSSGDAITLPGGATVVLSGTNQIATEAGSIIVSNGDLMVTGDGSLTGTSNGKNDSYHGIWTMGGDLTIDGCTIELSITPDFVSEVLMTAVYDSTSNKWLDKGGDFKLTGKANVTVGDTTELRTWGVCTGRYGFTNKDCGDLTIESGSTLTAKGGLGFYAGYGCNVTISGTLDTRNCDKDRISANVLNSDSKTKIDGTVLMADGTYMDTRGKQLDIQPTPNSTGAIWNPDMRSFWILSNKRGLNKGLLTYCNQKDTNVKMLSVADGAIFTIVPTDSDGSTGDQTLKLNHLSALSDLSGGGYVKVEDGAVVELTFDGATAEQVQALDLFCGKVKVNGTEATFHAGGIATCKEKAKCAVCGEEYGELGGHTYGTLIDEQPATTSTAGMKAHYFCAVCGTYFDTDQNQTTKEALTIPKLPSDPNPDPSTPSSSRDDDDDPSYSVTVPSGSSVANGSIQVTPRNAEKGSKVTITVTPDTGYVLGSLSITDYKGNELTLTDAGDGKYTFLMPGSAVKTSVSFVTEAVTPAPGPDQAFPFADVKADAYYREAVRWAVDEGITSGTSATTFGPDLPCSRGQIVTFLWRAAGSPAPTGALTFTDVAEGSYCADAVRWAAENGIASGTSKETFSPDLPCTRAQMAAFLYRSQKSPAVSGSSAFTDVNAGDYFHDAVLWAAQNGITSGISAAAYGPDALCTRAQMVMFLYRLMGK